MVHLWSDAGTVKVVEMWKSRKILKKINFWMYADFSHKYVNNNQKYFNEIQLLIYQVFCIIHVLNFFNFIYHNEVKKFPLMMFQACVNPYSYYSSNVMKVMPFDQCLIYLYCLVFICSNFYLYVFLNKQNERNIAKKESDVIR